MANTKQWLSIFLFGSSLALVTGCSPDQEITQPKPQSDAGEAVGEEDGFPLFAETHLQSGRVIWMDNCRNCHERGIADAPIVKEFEAWKPRIAKGKPTLYTHAINGFFGEDDSMMPAKGGNEELTDEQVKSAVDYMVATAIQYKTSN
jgi:cytochrome c5